MGSTLLPEADAASPAIRRFAEPIPEGWVYPCTLDELHARLAEFHAEDLRGLHAAGLAASTRKHWATNARYWHEPKSTIIVYSYPATLAYRREPATHRHHLELWQAVELHFGMRIEKVGSRWWCRWDADDLRRFILRHVVAHEVGHHVQYRQRQAERLIDRPSTRVMEQFAEAYAVRHW